MRWLTVDRLPLAALMLILSVSWLGADYFATNGKLFTTTAFTPVYQVYRRENVVPLAITIVCATMLAWVIPVGRKTSLSTLPRVGHATLGALGPLLLTGSAAALALGLYVKGGYLWSAPAYLSWAAPLPLVSVANLLTPLGIISAGAASPRWPVISAALATLNSLILFGGATRTLTIVLLAYLAGRWLAGGRVSPVAWFAGVASFFAILPIPLIARAQSQHGLLHYAPAVLDSLTKEDYFQQIPLLFAENLGFSLPLLLFVAGLPRFNFERYLLVQLNPLPAQDTNWPSVSQGMRVNDYAPYSALGEWANMGLWQLALFVFLLCLIIRLSVNSTSKHPTMLMLAFVGIELTLSLLSVFQVWQYNTRATSRLVTIMVAIAMLEYATRPLVIKLLGRDYHPRKAS